jgi:hypothetical protein
MILKKLFAFGIAISIIAFSSCKKSEPHSPVPAPTSSPVNLRNVSYEVIGTFTGTLYVSYTTASGSTSNETIAIPWSKAITYAASVDAAIIAITGNGGIIGQTATIEVKQNGIQKSSTTATAAGTTGSFSQSAPVVTF